MIKYDTEKYELAKQSYIDGMSLTKIQKEYGIERHAMSYLLQSEGISIKQNGQKHDYDTDIFKVIDTEEKAYWLGFLYADGNVINYGRYELKLSLAYQDIDHVKKFGDFILLNHNGKEILYPYMAKLKGNEYPSAKIVVASKKIVNDLIELGCVPNKSLVLSFPNNEQVPHHLIRHFIRGYFDGDGCVSIIKARPNSRLISFVGTDSFLSTLLDILSKEVDEDFANVKLYRKQSQHAYQFNKSNNKSVKAFYEYLYKDATIYLQRKYDRFVSKYGKL